MNRFHIFRHKRHEEFRWAIGEGDKALALLDSYQDAKSIVDVMNANAILDAEKIADLQTKSKETLHPHWLIVREAIRCRI